MIIYAKELNETIKLSLTDFDGCQEVDVPMTSRKNDYGVPDNYEVSDEGTISIMSVEDIEARTLVNQLKSAESALYSAVVSQKEDSGMDLYFYGLLMPLIVSTPVGPKAQACLDWMDTLWLDYYGRKGLLAIDPDLDFSAHGNVPHSYTEVRAEAEATNVTT